MGAPKGKVSGRSRALIHIDPIRLEIPETSLICPHCKVLCNFTLLDKQWNDNKAWTIQQCNGCKRIIFAVYDGTGAYIMHPGGGGSPNLNKKPSQVYPFIIPTYHKAVPAEVGEDYKEGLICHYAGAFNAAATMFRRTIQSSALNLGADPNKKLYIQINDLRDNGKIDQRTAEWAHELRLIGNVPGAHPDKDQPLRNVTQEESQDNVQFIEEFLRSAYEIPWKAAQRKAKRAS